MEQPIQAGDWTLEFTNALNDNVDIQITHIFTSPSQRITIPIPSTDYSEFEIVIYPTNGFNLYDPNNTLINFSQSSNILLSQDSGTPTIHMRQPLQAGNWTLAFTNALNHNANIQITHTFTHTFAPQNQIITIPIQNIDSFEFDIIIYSTNSFNFYDPNNTLINFSPNSNISFSQGPGTSTIHMRQPIQAGDWTLEFTNGSNENTVIVITPILQEGNINNNAESTTNSNDPNKSSTTRNEINILIIIAFIVFSIGIISLIGSLILTTILRKLRKKKDAN